MGPRKQQLNFVVGHCKGPEHTFSHCMGLQQLLLSAMFHEFLQVLQFKRLLKKQLLPSLLLMLQFL
jgi:hypothetical protein